MGSGLCGSKGGTGEELKSRHIDSELKKDHVSEKKKIKILLVGSADSGKSTIVKQMRLIHSAGFNETEAIDAIFVIRKNIVDAFHAIAVGVEQTNVDVPEGEKPVLEQFSHHSHEIENMDESSERQLMNDFLKLESVQLFLSQNPTWPTIPDNYAYFSMHTERILAADFMPTSLDMVHMRKATVGIHEFSFEFKKQTIRLIDVGGQRTERRKWIHFFEDVTAVMFVASLSSYDQDIEEDVKLVQVVATGQAPYCTVIRPQSSRQSIHKIERLFQNRLLDSMDLFNEIVKNEFLKTCSFILFLNKVDLFKSKLKSSPLSKYFETYTGGNDFDTALEYIENHFQKTPLPAPDSKLYTHYTEATDTHQIDFVFAAACDIILQANLARAGMQ